MDKISKIDMDILLSRCAGMLFCTLLNLPAVMLPPKLDFRRVGYDFILETCDKCHLC